MHGLLLTQVRRIAEENLELWAFTHHIQLRLVFGPDLKRVEPGDFCWEWEVGSGEERGCCFYCVLIL